MGDELVYVPKVVGEDPLATISIFIAACSAFFAAVAAGVSLWQALVVKRQLEHERKQKKIEETIRLSPFASAEYIAAVEELYNEFPNALLPGKKVSDDEIAKLNRDLSLARKFAVVFHFWNRVGIAYYGNVIDHELSEKMFKKAIGSFLNYFERYVEKRYPGQEQISVLRLHRDWKAN